LRRLVGTHVAIVLVQAITSGRQDRNVAPDDFGSPSPRIASSSLGSRLRTGRHGFARLAAALQYPDDADILTPGLVAPAEEATLANDSGARVGDG